MKLMHGTCSCLSIKILKDGLRAGSCLTVNEDIASYYAEVASDDCDCGEDVILLVDVSESELEADLNSFNEPLTFFRNNYAFSDDDWFMMIDSGDIPYPNKDEFQKSLDYVQSVVHKSSVSKESISML